MYINTSKKYPQELNKPKNILTANKMLIIKNKC